MSNLKLTQRKCGCFSEERGGESKMADTMSQLVSRLEGFIHNFQAPGEAVWMFQLKSGDPHNRAYQLSTYWSD
jgi:hypothetical protein